jgi:hypothetical protein
MEARNPAGTRGASPQPKHTSIIAPRMEEAGLARMRAAISIRTVARPSV